MRRDPDHFEGRELTLIYIAKRLKDALALEKLLTDHRMDYLVETDTYRGGIIFQTARVGAFFYVGDETVEAAHRLMKQHRFRPFEPLPAS
jgi:hypothetical protein